MNEISLDSTRLLQGAIIISILQTRKLKLRRANLPISTESARPQAKAIWFLSHWNQLAILPCSKPLNYTSFAFYTLPTLTWCTEFIRLFFNWLFTTVQFELQWHGFHQFLFQEMTLNLSPGDATIWCWRMFGSSHFSFPIKQDSLLSPLLSFPVKGYRPGYNFDILSTFKNVEKVV